MTAQPKVKEAPQAQEATGETQPEKRKYTKRPPDTSPAGQLKSAVLKYAKFSRAGDPEKAEEARQEEEAARKQLAQATDKAQQDELMKRIRLAANRRDRILERAGSTVDQQKAALDEVIKMAQEQRKALDDA